jgi:hypothetical protein
MAIIFRSYPFTQISGASFATFLARWAFSVAFATEITSLYAPGASSATPFIDAHFIIMPFCARFLTTSRPLHFFIACVLLIALPAPCEHELKQSSSLSSIPARIYENVPIVPPIKTGNLGTLY